MIEPRCAFIYSPEIERLSYPPDCPFKTQRAGLTRLRLMSLGLLGGGGSREVAPRKATLAELQLVHSAAYLEELQRAAGGDLTVDGLRMGLGGPDTPVFADVFEYGSWACGAGLSAAELLLNDEADVAFSLLGGFHHAAREHAAGFCYLNDAALACEHLARAGKRVLYLDVDAHHGDGVQEAFYRRNDVMTVSLHESGKTLFPWGGFESEIGSGPGRGHNVNVPLPAGTYDEAYLFAFKEVVPPLIEASAPEVIVLELGMDTLAGDPLTHFVLTNNVHVEILRMLAAFGKRLLVLGGGGYHVENTVRGWALAWKTLQGAGEEHDLSAGFGGIMLGSTEWAGGLCDRALPVTDSQRRAVEPELHATLQNIMHTIFPLHRLVAQTLPA